MAKQVPARDVGEWFGERVEPGEARNVELPVAESYSGVMVRIPVHVRRAEKPGPTLFVTAAVHGDEINGAGTIRTLINDETLKLEKGSLVLVPVVNVLAFERHSRYLPDRRDLNRSFPGSLEGSLASRYARHVHDELIARCDCGIDLHTAAVRRTNFPNVRGNMKNHKVRALAEAFGCEIIVAGKGPKGSFRAAACQSGCPTMMLEAGEVWKTEPAVIEYSIRGVKNVLGSLGMIDQKPIKPPYQIVLEKTKWVRSNAAGFLDFHVAPGTLVKQGEPLATTSSLLGDSAHVIEAPTDGIIIGMTTLPVTAPGEPICHLGLLPAGTQKISRIVNRLSEDNLHQRVRDDLATNITVVDADETSPETVVDEPGK